jgi:hypothetical protein
MTKEQLLAKRIYWPKLAMFGFAIVLPQAAVGWSNREVFPDALWIATIIVIVIIGISGISTYFSGNAAPKTRRYALWHDFAVAALTCVVVLFHFQVAREVSAGKEARKVLRETEKTGQDNLDRDTQRQLALKEADREAAKIETEKLREQRRVLLQLPPSQRRAIGPAPTAAPTATAFSSLPTISEQKGTVRAKTPEEVRMDWFGWLFWASALEIVVAVLGGMVLMMVWQWDVDGDGITDHPQQPKVTMAMSPSPATVAAKQGNTTINSNFTQPRQ